MPTSSSSPERRRAARPAIVAAVMAAVIAGLGTASSSWARPPGDLRSAIEDVAGADGKRYNARDGTGRVIDTAKIIQDHTGGYLAVYHYLNQAEARFHVSVATSTNLLDWTFRHDFGAGTHQPTIHAIDDGLSGYVVAWEQDPDNHLSFRYFRSRADLLGGTAARS